MASIGRWIWAGLRAIGRALKDIFALVWNVLSSALTWVVASIAYLVDRFQGWINDAISGGLLPLLDEIGVEASEFPEVGPLAAYYLGMFAMDEAVTCLVELFAFWILARTARLVMVPIRAILEIL